MKKSIRYIALLLALVTLFASSVSAADYDSPWISILNFDSGAPNGKSLTFNGSGMMEFNFPESVYMRRLQGVISANFSNLTSLKWSATETGQKYSLTLIDAGNGLYRFYSDSISTTSDKIFLHFENTNANTTTVLEVVSFDYSPLRFWTYAETGTMAIYSTSYTMSTPTSSVTHNWSSSSSGEFVAHFTCPDWRIYDSLTFFIYGFGADINSIVGRFGDVPVPVSVTYLDSANWEESRYSLMATLDLSGLDRNSTGDPEVELCGWRRTTDSEYYICLTGITGSVYATDTSDMDVVRQFESYLGDLFDNMSARQDSYFDYYAQWNADMYSLQLTQWMELFDELREGFVNIDSRFNDVLYDLSITRDYVLDRIDTFQATFVSEIYDFRTSMESLLESLLHADKSGSEEFEDDVASQATEFEDISETLDSVTKPPVDDLDPSVDDVVSPDDVSNYTSVLAVLLSNQIFLSVCLMSLTFALVSYTVYGKR